MKKRVKRLVCRKCGLRFRTNTKRNGWRCPQCHGRTIEIVDR